MNDHELTVLVEAAASGAVNSQAAHHGGDTWDELHASIKNGVREAALPFIYHGTKALAELGYTKPRTITTYAELDALYAADVNAVVISEDGFALQNLAGGWKCPGSQMFMHSDAAFRIYGPTFTVLSESKP